MTGTPRPWWASDDPAAGLDDLDPVEAFRAVRRPAGAGGDRADPASSGSSASGSSASGPSATGPDGAGSGSPATDGPHRPELCGICPLCTLARTLEETRPELVEHVTEAARHLTAAVRALLEPPGSGPGHPGSSRDRLQHIDLERDEPDRTASDPGAGP